jgi:hypothetical protein
MLPRVADAASAVRVVVALAAIGADASYSRSVHACRPATTFSGGLGFACSPPYIYRAYIIYEHDRCALVQ